MLIFGHFEPIFLFLDRTKFSPKFRFASFWILPLSTFTSSYKEKLSISNFNFIGPSVFGGSREKKNTGRLAITFRYLTSGETQQSLSYSYRIGRSNLSAIIVEICKAIYTAPKDCYLKSPSTEDDSKVIDARFEEV